MMIERAIAYREDENEEVISALKEAEEKIQRIVLNLADEYGLRIAAIAIDTRNFSNYATSIIVESAA
jgi:hypothetical protein